MTKPPGELAAEALKRIRQGVALSNEQAALVEGHLRRLQDRESISFIHKDGCYQVGDAILPESLGLKYLQRLLQASQATVESERDVHCVSLYTDDKIGAFGIQYSDNPYDTSSDEDWLRSFTTAATDPILDERSLREYRAEIRRLRSAGETPATSSDLKFLEEQIERSTFRGKNKTFYNEEERARQSVRKAIKSAIKRLNDDPATHEIGSHLNMNHKTGFYCRYTGSLRWRFN